MAQPPRHAEAVVQRNVRSSLDSGCLAVRAIQQSSRQLPGRNGLCLLLVGDRPGRGLALPGTRIVNLEQSGVLHQTSEYLAPAGIEQPGYPSRQALDR